MVFSLMSLVLMSKIIASSSSDLELIETARIFDNGPYQVWEDIYDLIIRDYVTDVYVDIMETFIAASIKLLGWAAFGTFLVIKGAFLNSQPPIESAGSGYNSYKVPSYGSGYHSPNYQTGRTIVHQSSLTEDFGGIKNDLYPLNYTIPYMGKYLGLELTFPVDNTLQECFEERESCVNNDWDAEVDHLFARITEVRNFMSRWMEIGEKLVFLTEMDEDSVDADPEI